MTDGGSSVPRRQLGRYLRAAREQAGISLEMAARELEVSRATMYRIEGGGTAVRKADVVAMCTHYGVPAEMTTALVALAAETKAKGWWHAYGDAIPSWFELYVGLEAAASRLRTYAPEVVPGLLRTEAYAEEALRVTQPALPDEAVRRMVAVTGHRQATLSRRTPPPPKLEVVLNESVLRRSLRDRASMAAQLHHILALTERRTATVRIMPLDAGLHPAVAAGGTFTILTFTPRDSGEAEPPTVYHEGLTAASYLDKAADVEAYDNAWAGLRGAVLDEADSRALLADAAKSYE